MNTNQRFNVGNIVALNYSFSPVGIIRMRTGTGRYVVTFCDGVTKAYEPASLRHSDVEPFGLMPYATPR